MVSYPSQPNSSFASDSSVYSSDREIAILPFASERPIHWLLFAASVFLIAVPVFIQAPLVRFLPWVSLALTPALLVLGLRLSTRPLTALWGDLLVGFTWTWLAGSIYWGWLRWEPFLHLPVESIGLPIVGFCLAKRWGKIGGWFYFGSLLGTALTDLYFYLVDLIPYWRQLMQVPPDLARPIFQNALVQMQTPWGIGSALTLLGILVSIGYFPLCSRQLHWWAFGGAVLSTILVDGLFWLAATLA